MKVVKEVFILLVNVWLIDSLTNLALSSSVAAAALLSRILSNITIVALIEYPTNVSKHAINVLPTVIWVIAYTLNTINTSCIRGITEPSAKLNFLNLAQI